MNAVRRLFEFWCSSKIMDTIMMIISDFYHDSFFCQQVMMKSFSFYGRKNRLHSEGEWEFFSDKAIEMLVNLLHLKKSHLSISFFVTILLVQSIYHICQTCCTIEIEIKTVYWKWRITHAKLQYLYKTDMHSVIPHHETNYCQDELIETWENRHRYVRRYSE